MVQTSCILLMLFAHFLHRFPYINTVRATEASCLLLPLPMEFTPQLERFQFGSILERSKCQKSHLHMLCSPIFSWHKQKELFSDRYKVWKTKKQHRRELCSERDCLLFLALLTFKRSKTEEGTVTQAACSPLRAGIGPAHLCIFAWQEGWKRR